MRIRAVVHNIPLDFETAPTLFSPNHVDRGSCLLLSQVGFEPADKVLDLGCGYGLLGIYAAKHLSPENVYLLDIDPLAVKLATTNAALNNVTGVHVERSDGFRDFRATGFTKILCNPPYHADFSVAKHLIEKSFNRLVIGGSLWMVTKRDRWYRNKLTSIFGGARVVSQDSYCVFQAVRKSAAYAKSSRH